MIILLFSLLKMNTEKLPVQSRSVRFFSLPKEKKKKIWLKFTIASVSSARFLLSLLVLGKIC